MHFELEAFNADTQMDVSGSLDSSAVVLDDVSAVAVFDYDVQNFLDTFKFESDASDVDTIGDSTDVRYYVHKANFPEFNPLHASLHTAKLDEVGASEKVSAGAAIATGYDTDESSIMHDFVRYLALRLFNTHHGVDLFANETALIADLSNVGDRDLWGDATKGITKALTDAETANPMENNDTGADNLTRTLLLQLQRSQDGRDRLAASVASVGPGTQASVPLEAGDTVSFKVGIDAETNQHNLTGVNAIEKRTYRVVLHLRATADVANTTPDNANGA